MKKHPNNWYVVAHENFIPTLRSIQVVLPVIEGKPLECSSKEKLQKIRQFLYTNSMRTVMASVFGTLPLTVWTTTEVLLQVQGPLGSIWKPMRPGRGEEEGRLAWIE